MGEKKGRPQCTTFIDPVVERHRKKRRNRAALTRKRVKRSLPLSSLKGDKKKRRTKLTAEEGKKKEMECIHELVSIL